MRKDETGALQLHTTAGARAVCAALQRWYSERARIVFADRTTRLLQEIALFAELDYQLRVRRMTRRWGSCTTGGVITLNPLLVQASLACIDYVIAHELVHLLEPAHTPRFYTLLGRAMPGWERQKRSLGLTPIRAL